MYLTPSTPQPYHSAPASYFVWEPEGQRIEVHLRAEAVDQIGVAVMLGFGALRKRGAEAGGLLLGTVQRGGKTVVRVEKFVAVHCSHLYGPSYVLSEDDLLGMDRLAASYSADSGSLLRVVGFFRSHTREPLQLTEADLALLDAQFPNPEDICLLVKPFPTRPSEAIFLTRQGGAFSVEPQTETFVFRRKEMQLPPAPRRERSVSHGPGEALAEGIGLEAAGFAPEAAREMSRTRMGRPRLGREDRQSEAARQPELEAEAPGGITRLALDVQGELQSDVRKAPVRRYRWVWLWLSFVFLLLGGFIGGALTLTTMVVRSEVRSRDTYSTGLTVERAGEKIRLKWNPGLPVVQRALRAELAIEEGGATKTEPLSTSDLAHGGIVYRGAAGRVIFHLTLFLSDHASFSETVESPTEVQAEPQAEEK